MAAAEATWLPEFLREIRTELKTPLPNWHFEEPTKEDLQWIEQQIHDKQFDKLELKKEMFNALGKTAHIEKCVCSLGSILALTLEPISKEQWTEWWHCVRLLSKKVRVVFYLHPRKREFPPKNQPIGAEHINGGSTERCNPNSIIVYRKEEATRVLIHELFHANCSDPAFQVPFVEADTEAWAELVLVALRNKNFQTAWKRHLQYSADLVRYLEENHFVKDPNDYGWRYTKGRLNVWYRLGFEIPVGRPRHFATLALT